MVTLADIEAAAARIAGQVLDTPCVESKTLSQIVGAQVFLKFENLQFTASFKERGALNKLLALVDEGVRGVVAASAGNHAQGVAHHAQRLGLRAVIVMPRFAPGVKVERTRGFGAEVVLHGETFDEAREHAMGLAQSQGLAFVHAFDDPLIIAGQGTIGLEMLRQQPSIDTLVVAVGGGGLLAGIATAARALKPDIQIIGVQTERFPAMVNAIKGTTHPQGTTTIAEGIAVGQPGRITREILCAPGRRHAAGRRRRHRAVDRDAARDREDAGRRRRCRRPGRAAEAPRALRRPQGRPGAVRRQHRPAAAGRDHRTRHGARRAPGAHPRRRARHARRAGAHHRAGGRRRREHRRGAPPARVLDAVGAERRDRTGAADAQPGACGRGGGAAARRRGLRRRLVSPSQSFD